MLALSERHVAEMLGQTLALLDANDSQILALAHSWARETCTTTPDRFVFLVRRAVQLTRGLDPVEDDHKDDLQAGYRSPTWDQMLGPIEDSDLMRERDAYRELGKEGRI